MIFLSILKFVLSNKHLPEPAMAHDPYDGHIYASSVVSS